MRIRAKKIVHEHIVDEFDHANISPEQEYIVIGLDEEYYRVINDAGEPVLYPHGLFDVVDSTIPPDWIRIKDADGQEYVGPPDCAARGFFEDYFDGDPDAIAKLQRVIARL